MSKSRINLIGVFVLSIMLAVVYPGFGYSSVLTVKAAAFEPGNLVTDATFTAKDSMSAADIQSFLQTKGSVLASIASDQLGEGANGRTAAQIIYDATRGSRTDFASSKYGPSNPLVISINPQVILVTLQKEQSLITGTYVSGSSSTNNALRTAMGYGCPDGGGCDASYAGFTNQVIYATAQLIYNYYQAANLDYKPGQTYTISNTTGAPYYAPATQQVTIGNSATSSLYRYTPHVYNGNYNFWYYINSWFSPVQNIFSSGARLIKGDSSNEVYVYSPKLNKKWYLVEMEALSAWGVSAPLEVQSESFVSSISTGYGSLSRLQYTQQSNAVYYLEGGKRYHLASESQLQDKRVPWNVVSQVDSQILDTLPTGPPLGLLCKSSIRSEVYLVTAGHKYYIPDEATIYNWGYTWNDIDTIAQSEIDPYPNGGSLKNLFIFDDGPSVFVMSGGARMYVDSLDTINNWGMNLGSLSTIGLERKVLMSTGPKLTRVVKATGPQVYFIEGGKKRYVSSFSRLNAKGFSQNQLVQVSDYLLGLLPLGQSL